ncbi:SURF1 family protein [Vibrio sp. HN007]|uniref:SURF1 family protein n=1 Tax=Vibrio iocasae TaxID=3098914 RepID=UPI0035D4F56A
MSVSFIGLTLLTLVVFALLVKLGLWQLSRGDEKQTIEDQLKQRAVAPFVSISSITSTSSITSISSTTDSPADITGLRVTANITNLWDSNKIYLDNQVHQGKAGYLVYQVVQIESSPKHLLVELGFIAGGADRNTLPDISFDVPTGEVSGRLYSRMANPLSSDLFPESLTHLRIQNLNLTQLSQEIGLPLLPYVLQPQSTEPWPLPQPWKPLPMASAKHYGYAFQWFSMAGVWLLLMVIVSIRTIQSRSIKNHTPKNKTGSRL